MKLNRRKLRRLIEAALREEDKHNKKEKDHDEEKDHDKEEKHSLSVKKVNVKDKKTNKPKSVLKAMIGPPHNEVGMYIVPNPSAPTLGLAGHTTVPIKFFDIPTQAYVSAHLEVDPEHAHGSGIIGLEKELKNGFNIYIENQTDIPAHLGDHPSIETDKVSNTTRLGFRKSFDKSGHKGHN